MDAADLAKEVVAFAIRDRPSNLVLVIKRRGKTFLKITAPIENGRRSTHQTDGHHKDC